MPQRSINQAIRCVRERSTGLPLPCDLPLTINLHPDAPFGKGTMIEGLATAGVYRSQFETRTSNGGLTAHPGGDRWNWESRIFGAAYDQASPAHRPNTVRSTIREARRADRRASGHPTSGSGPMS